jgi:hypothetical protein
VIDVAWDGFAGHIEFRGEAGAVELRAIPETLVNEHHTFDGEPGAETGG